MIKMIRKVIYITRCEECPYVEFDKVNLIYYCRKIRKHITIAEEREGIPIECPLMTYGQYFT